MLQCTWGNSHLRHEGQEQDNHAADALAQAVGSCVISEQNLEQHDEDLHANQAQQQCSPSADVISESPSMYEDIKILA